MFAVGLVATATVAVAAMESAVLSQIQQDARCKRLPQQLGSSKRKPR